MKAPSRLGSYGYVRCCLNATCALLHCLPAGGRGYMAWAARILARLVIAAHHMQQRMTRAQVGHARVC